MSLMLFILVLIASFIIVRIGAIAFQLTGLEWSLAKFQALSCFSGTGFTTRESELIVGHSQRRRIATILIVLGNAGLVTMVATAASSLNPDNTILGWISESYLPFLPRWSVVWFNLGIVAVFLFIIYKISVNNNLTHKYTNYLRSKILKRERFKPLSFEEILIITAGYGIARTQIPEGHALVDKTVAESELRKNDISILAIVREDTTMPNPTADTAIHEGDELLLFGKLDNIRGQLKVGYL